MVTPNNQDKVRRYLTKRAHAKPGKDANGRAPNYLGIKNPGQPELASYDTLNLYSKVLTAYKNSGQLPASIQIP